MTFAKFWHRIFAGIIDGTILAPLELVRMIYAPHNWKVILIGYILIGIYYVFFLMRYAATPGMMAMRIQIIMKKDLQFTVDRAILRYIGLQISCLTIIGGLWMLWDKKKQMLHDKFVGTYVVETPGGEKGTVVHAH